VGAFLTSKPAFRRYFCPSHIIEMCCAKAKTGVRIPVGAYLPLRPAISRSFCPSHITEMCCAMVKTGVRIPVGPFPGNPGSSVKHAIAGRLELSGSLLADFIPDKVNVQRFKIRLAKMLLA